MAALAVRSGWVAPIGPFLSEFEDSIATLSRRQFAVAVSSGTAALHLSLLGLGVGKGQLVLCSTLTFVATANAIAYTGAVPVFIDVSSDTGNMSPDLLREAIIDLREQDLEIGAIIPVDFLGKVADYKSIVDIARDFDIPVVADAAESLGATRHSEPAGSFGDAAIFSFNGNKIVTTSGGGVVVTDDEFVAHRVRHLATQAREPERHYEHIEVGYNYRLSNILAAIGLAQLQRLNSMIAKRRDIRSLYRNLVAEHQGVEIFGDPSNEDNHWLTALRFEAEASHNAGSLCDFLEEHNIESRPLWKPMHLQPLYKDARAYLDGSSEEIYLCSLALPSGSGLSASQIEETVSLVGRFLDRR